MALDDAAIDDPVLGQVLGQLRRLDPRRDEILGPVWEGLLQGALDLVLTDPDLFNLVFVEQFLELAIRDRRRLSAL
jgi:hypothetical protein